MLDVIANSGCVVNNLSNRMNLHTYILRMEEMKIQENINRKNKIKS